MKKAIVINANDFSEKFTNRKPKTKGSDLGFMAQEATTGQDIMFKTGISLTLLAQALETYWKENDANKPIDQRKIDFIVGNYARVSKKEDKDVAGIKSLLPVAINKFLNTEYANAFKTKVLNDEHLSPTDTFNICKALKDEDGKSLMRILYAPTFAEVLCGTYSQELYNQFIKQKNPDFKCAEQILVTIPNGSPCLYMGSLMVKEVRGLHDFLLEPFLTGLKAGSTNWIEEGEKALKEELSRVEVDGLVSAILFRLLMGENDDLGPDNMLLVKNKASYQIINIDLSGFRFDRKEDYSDKDKNDKQKICLGWGSILSDNDHKSIIAKIFNKSIFSDRFIRINDIDRKKQPEVYTAIVAILQECVASKVNKEVADLMDWMTTLESGALTSEITFHSLGVYEQIAAPTQISEEDSNAIIGKISSFLENLLANIPRKKLESESIEETNRLRYRI